MNITLLPITKKDTEFIYEPTKAAMQAHVEQTWGQFPSGPNHQRMSFLSSVVMRNETPLRINVHWSPLVPHLSGIERGLKFISTPVRGKV